MWCKLPFEAIFAAFVIRNLQILRRGRLRVRHFLNTKYCTRVSQRHFWWENVIAVVILLRIFRQSLDSIAQKEVAGAQRVQRKQGLGGGAQSRGLTNLLLSYGVQPFPNFCENVVVAETSYQRFIILLSGEGLTSLYKDNGANFSG